MKKTIGILGGIGPLATCDLFHKVVEVTEAGRTRSISGSVWTATRDPGPDRGDS